MTRPHDWRCTGVSGDFRRWECAHGSCDEVYMLPKGKEPKPGSCPEPKRPEKVEA